MSAYFITGGRQRPAHLLTREEWHAYDKAVLLRLDTRTGAVRTVLEYTSPPDRCPLHSPSFVFKAGSWDGSHLLLCTQTEVVVFDPQRERVVRTISHPWLNDVHHVARLGGRLHVVSTGLDALLVFDEHDAEVVEVHSAIQADVWARHHPETDYRRISTTKPHQAHPNYVYTLGGARWITRFEQRDTCCIEASSAETPPPPPLQLADDPIHDGVVDDMGRVWFTVVSGAVVVAAPTQQRILHRYDLNLLERGGEGEGRPLGWCRGIYLEPTRTLLAFSRLRPTTLKQNLSWLRRPLGKAPEPLPTRIAAYDLPGSRKLATWSLEDAGISSIFSILPALESS